MLLAHEGHTKPTPVPCSSTGTLCWTTRDGRVLTLEKLSFGMDTALREAGRKGGTSQGQQGTNPGAGLGLMQANPEAGLGLELAELGAGFGAGRAEFGAGTAWGWVWRWQSRICCWHGWVWCQGRAGFGFNRVQGWVW